MIQSNCDLPQPKLALISAMSSLLRICTFHTVLHAPELSDFGQLTVGLVNLRA